MSAFKCYHAAVETKYIMGPFGRQLDYLLGLEVDMCDELRNSLNKMREAHIECMNIALKVISVEKPEEPVLPDGTDRGIADFLAGDSCCGGESAHGGCGGGCNGCKP